METDDVGVPVAGGVEELEDGGFSVRVVRCGGMGLAYFEGEGRGGGAV